MYFNKLALAAGVALASLATPALAQDTGSDAQSGTTTSTETAAPASDWDPTQKPFQGFYIGGAVSYDVQANDYASGILFNRAGSTTVTTAAGANAFSPGFCGGAATSSANIGCRNDRDDIGYYGRVGFDLQSGALVVGALAEFGKSEIEDSVSAFSTTPASYTMTRKVDWELGLRGRVGYAARTTLFYATGGAGYVRINNRFTTSNTANAFVTNGNGEKWGYQTGLGIEQKLGKNFSVGLEYLYHNYEDDNYRVVATQGTAPATNPFVLNSPGGTIFRRSDPTFDWHSIRLTAAFRF
ncbi:MAG: hypothetical protein K2X76_11410 [Sphingomonas sp.]|nr:hypothetical protein [Sphingomonas sp.]